MDGGPSRGRPARRGAVPIVLRRRRVIATLVAAAAAITAALTLVAPTAPGVTENPVTPMAGDLPTGLDRSGRWALPGVGPAPSEGVQAATTAAGSGGSAPAVGASGSGTTGTPSYGTLTVVDAPLHYGATRRAQMAEYARRHYGSASEELRPSAIVLHFTETSRAQDVIDTFAENAPSLGELPGVCAHYVVDQDGTIYALVPPTLMCRHAIGFNHRSIGIECVQSTLGHPPAWADQQILDRKAQVTALVGLVKTLQATYGIATEEIYGHATVNDAPGFLDLQGWRNDHLDWQAPAVAQFRRLLG